jgi:hypothetical protein
MSSEMVVIPPELEPENMPPGPVDAHPEELIEDYDSGGEEKVTDGVILIKGYSCFIPEHQKFTLHSDDTLLCSSFSLLSCHFVWRAGDISCCWPYIIGDPQTFKLS